MTAPRQLWILAGGNGAGKSTFHRLFLAPRGVKLLNADMIAADLDPATPARAGYRASYLTAKLGEELLRQGLSFCYETVFSHETKIDFVAKAKALGYQIVLVYIHLETVALNEARVAQRVSEGGHSVPHEKIRTRIPRTLEHIAAVLPLVDEARLLDNSLRGDPYRQMALVKQGQRLDSIDPLPKWAEDLLKSIA